ncbi:hypothetical protein [Paenibacillus typhae]|uniref:hypothetical protein n=1 Tax=Paenibacillus typhae TaxID=1174501 RepID=UPI001C8DE714|nr:hypothetical protein [Paenibacillus typhae]MBY0011508.1 hypothetical protein [Paenibacillus typhae]
MSVIVAVVAKPNDGLRPYVLMGSDSLHIGKIISEDGRSLVEYSRDEDFKKVHRVNNKLIGMAGHFDSSITHSFLDYVERNDEEILVLSQKLLIFLEEAFIKKPIEIKQRCTVLVASCDHGDPIVTKLVVDEADMSSANVEVIRLEAHGFYPAFIGASGLEDLELKFVKRTLDSNANYNILAMKKAVNAYLLEAAARRSDICNQNIKIEKLT